MKKFLSILIIIISANSIFAQKKEISLKLGVIDPESFGEYGYNIEFGYKFEFEKIPRLSAGIGLGFGKRNTFTDMFNKSFLFADNNDVTQEIDDHIRSLTFEEALDFHFESYNANYLRFMVYFEVVQFLGFKSSLYTGVFIRDENGADFDIYQYSLENNMISDYRSNYRVYQNTSLGWPLGIEIEKKVALKYNLLIDANYGIPFNTEDDIFVNFFLRAGISREF
ncbi:hypothetical protein SAMN05421640_1295 [Ekhidna lutea]|uniref:Outer membrane protein beta-barrel domain-containing protein n=1 Tax=Ekhidna lutea TaxID=447679 RepID=A0A239HJ62_EKHLU|nr:hypothetical protein [Ekhidna lutea]SNS80304.1 hypothetical protein SAMN05421640_1295 [Ekhidna lutea]